MCPLFLFFFFVMALMFHSQAYAGGNYWSVSVDNEIALSETKIILMTVINSVDPVLNECEKISVQIAKPEGFIVWVISIFNIKDKDTEKTNEAIMLLNKKNARSELALFGYIGGGLKSSGENECVFTSKRLEIDNSKEGLSPVIFAFN